MLSNSQRFTSQFPMLMVATGTWQLAAGHFQISNPTNRGFLDAPPGSLSRSSGRSKNVPNTWHKHPIQG